MLRILHSISQDLEKIRDRKSLHIKHAYGFDEVVRDDVCYEDNEENGNFVSLIIPSEENTNWPFVSTTNPQYKDIDLDQLPKFDAYLDIVGQEEIWRQSTQAQVQRLNLLSFKLRLNQYKICIINFANLNARELSKLSDVGTNWAR
ncbi:hypothetical protein WN943_021359 [Citrus x changshan-huyou]